MVDATDLKSVDRYDRESSSLSAPILLKQTHNRVVEFRVIAYVSEMLTL